MHLFARLHTTFVEHLCDVIPTSQTLNASLTEEEISRLIS